MTNTLGTLEQATMAAVFKLRDGAYGTAIWEHVHDELGREISVGAINTTLMRLEKKGFLSSKKGEATPERGGRAKRYYKLEGAGIVALNSTKETLDRIWSNLPVTA